MSLEEHEWRRWGLVPVAVREGTHWLRAEGKTEGSGLEGGGETLLLWAGSSRREPLWQNLAGPLSTKGQGGQQGPHPESAHQLAQNVPHWQAL